MISLYGVTDNSGDERPPDVRRAYAQVMDRLGDQNQSGVPDMFLALVMAYGGPAQLAFRAFTR